MPSPINSRLAARSHQQQIALVRKTDAIAAKVGACYRRLVGRLMRIAADGLVGLRGAVHSAVHQAEAEALHVLESEYPKLVRSQYADAKAVVLRTVPARWFRLLARPGIAREDVMPEFRNEWWYLRHRMADINPKDYKQAVENHIFPPLPAEKVSAILTSPGYNKLTWQDRFRHYVPADQNAIATELQEGIASGEPIAALRRRMETIVDGPRYKAERIARTEGRRVAEQGSMEAYSGLGDMLDGMQIMAVMDQATRPEHASRNGKIYRQRENGQFYDETGRPLPELPDAPNCRCFALPVFKMPKEFEEDPRVAAEFATAASKNIPDPAAYTEWWAGADEKDQREAVGTRRYQIVSDRLPEGVRPEWIDFIDTEGSLVPLKELKAERHAEREERKAEVRSMLAERERLYREVAGKGFVGPSAGGGAKKPPEPTKSPPDAPEPHDPLPVTPAKNVTIFIPSKAVINELTEDIFGRALTEDELKGLSAACSGGHVTATTQEGKLSLVVESATGVRSHVLAWLDRGAARHVEIAGMRIPDHLQQHGLGTQMLARLVSQAKQLRVKYISGDAARGAKTYGYYVWPRLGFNAPLPKGWLAEHAEEIADFPKAPKVVRDLMRTSAGRKLWWEKGEAIRVSMNLAPDSPDAKILGQYMANEMKKARWIVDEDFPVNDAPLFQESDDPEVGMGDPIGPYQDADILDAIWDRIDAEESAAEAAKQSQEQKK